MLRHLRDFMITLLKILTNLGCGNFIIHFDKMSLCMDQLYETWGSRSMNVSIREKAGWALELAWMQWQT